MTPTWNRTEPPSNALAVGWISLKWAHSKHRDVPAMMLKLPIRNLIRDFSKEPLGDVGPPGPIPFRYFKGFWNGSGMGAAWEMGVPPWNVPRIFFDPLLPTIQSMENVFVIVTAQECSSLATQSAQIFGIM